MLSEYQFNDLDGIVVIASLYIDNENKLFELDIWKTNCAPLKKLPFDLGSIQICFFRKEIKNRDKIL